MGAKIKLGNWTLEVENDRVFLKEKGWLRASALPNEEEEGYVVVTHIDEDNSVKVIDITSQSSHLALLKHLKLNGMSQEDLYTVINLISSTLARRHRLKVGSRICSSIENITPIEITFRKDDETFILVIYIDTKKKAFGGFEAAVGYTIGPDGVAVDHARGKALLDKLNELASN